MIAELPEWRLISFRGADWRQFLQGLLTNDVAHLKPRHGCPCCLLTPKGKMLAYFDLYDRGDDALVIAPASAAENIKKELGKKIVLSETSMEEPKGFSLLFLFGDESGASLAEAFPGLKLGEYESANVSWAGTSIEIFRTRFLTGGGYWIVVPAERSKDFHPAPAAGWSAVDAARIEAGEPVFGVDLDDQTFPAEAGLEKTISFTKGCYMGQETVTRIKTMGHVNRKLFKLQAASPVDGQNPVFAGGKEIGRITSSAGGSALAMLKVEGGLPPETVEIKIADRRVTARVVR